MPEISAAAAGGHRKNVFPLAPDTVCGCVLPCDENLADALENLPDTVTVAGIRVNTDEQAAFFAGAQYAADRPVCFFCEDAGLLERVLRLYQGRALYEGSLPEEALRPLREKYGLIY